MGVHRFHRRSLAKPIQALLRECTRSYAAGEQVVLQAAGEPHALVARAVEDGAPLEGDRPEHEAPRARVLGHRQVRLARLLTVRVRVHGSGEG